MYLGILHLTDLHINGKENFDKELKSLINICIADFCQCERIVIVVTGDIAFSGACEEYVLATSFFSELRDRISEKKPTDILFVPGNHDCNFTQDDSARQRRHQDL